MARRRVYNHTKRLKNLVRYMLKMLSHYGLAECYFCEESLLTDDTDLLHITVHHVNEDHDDDRPENLRLTHERCHRGHHARRILHGIGAESGA